MDEWRAGRATLFLDALLLLLSGGVLASGGAKPDAAWLEDKVWIELVNLATLPAFLLTELDTGAVDVRRVRALCIRSHNLTNYKCIGPAGSRSILARVNVTSGYGSILHQQQLYNCNGLKPCPPKRKPNV